jgi:hypothetical protein
VTEIPVYPPGEAPGAGSGVSAGAQLSVGPVDMLARLELSLGKMTAKMERDYQRRVQYSLAVTPIIIDPVPMVLVSAGVYALDPPQLFRPTMGRYWDVHVCTAEGFTAGTVQGRLNIPAGAAQVGGLTFPFSAAGQLTYGKGQVLLRGNGDRIVFFASGITLATGFAAPLISLRATAVLDPWIGEYLR